jgi:hypothetical protein
LQLALISIELAKKREPMQSFTMLVLNTVIWPSPKKVEPRHLQLARSEEERVWKVSVFPMAMRSAWPTSRTTEMLAKKLKWIGRETNSYNSRRCSVSTNGRMILTVCSSNQWMNETSNLYRSASWWTKLWKLFF